MRKLISWLSFMMAFFLLLLSCIHDEIYTPSEQERQGIVSKSLWKEDTLFIHRIYDHFGKSFMPSVEKKEAFISEYGTPAWEYAMTMGFGKNQLYVPVIKNGRVHGMIRVLRQDRQASYSFTQDREALDFFETVIYNPRNCHLKPQKDEKTGTANSAKAGGYTWKCTKRIVTTGWHMEGETMVLETAVVESCKYTYTGMNPAVDHLEVATDGMESGGGDDEGEEYEGSPCEKMKAQNQNQGFKDKVAALDTAEMFNKSTETGYSAAYGTVPYESLANSSNGNVMFPEGNKYFGYMHTHLNMEGVVKIFSPYDVATFLTSCVANAKLKGNMTDAYAMVITSEGNYILKYSGDGNFAVTVGQLESWKAWYSDNFESLYIKGNLNQVNVEKLFTQFLQEVVNVTGLEIYKSDKNSGNASKLQYNGKDNPVQSQPCP